MSKQSTLWGSWKRGGQEVAVSGTDAVSRELERQAAERGAATRARSHKTSHKQARNDQHRRQTRRANALVRHKNERLLPAGLSEPTQDPEPAVYDRGLKKITPL